MKPLQGLLVVMLAANAAQAVDVVEDSGVDGGIFVRIGCDNPDALMALKADNCIVQGLDTDAANVKKARQHIKSLGIYGKVTAETFDGKHLPYADNLINLLIVEDSVNMTTVEIMRVLAPRGVVCLRKDGKWQKQTKAWPDDIDE